MLGGGGFIGGHLAKRLKAEGCFVRIADIKTHEYFDPTIICDEFMRVDLRDPRAVASVISESDDEVYQLAADMGGAMVCRRAVSCMSTNASKPCCA